MIFGKNEADQTQDNHHLLKVLDAVPALISYWRQDLTNGFANSRYGEWLGLAGDISGISLVDLLGPEHFQQNWPHIEAVLQGAPQLFESTFQNRSGDIRYCQVSYIPDIQAGLVCGFFSMATDVTVRKLVEITVAETRERMRITLSSIGDAVIATDDQGQVTFLNPIAERMTGWKLDEAIGLPIEMVMDFRNMTSRSPSVNPLRIAIAEQRTVEMARNCILISRSGEEFGIEDSSAPIRETNGTLVGAVIVFHDVSEVRAMAIKMSHLAQHDALTDLANRVLLQDRLEIALIRAPRRKERFAVLFLDLDSFKQVNDTLGHPGGDELLREVANRILSCVRAGDTVSRQGGDEFIVLMQDIESVSHVTAFASRILAEIKRPYDLEIGGNKCEARVTCSVGIALYPEDGDTSEILLQRADAAMYLAKQSGRDQFHFCSLKMENELLARQELTDQMRTSIDMGGFSVVYQPIVESLTYKLRGVEALLRWQTTDGNWIPPSDFIPLSEENGLILQLGQFVLQTACRQCRQWIDEGIGEVQVSVNISPKQISANFLAFLMVTLQETGIRPSLLCLEITETALMHSAAHEILQSIKALGVRISLDDFGTGFSSFIHLVQFPLDELKIDRSFVAGIESGAKEAIVNSICGLGRALNLNVVAEGVETADQLAKLEAFSCRTLQGYLFSVPVLPSKISELVGRNLNAGSGTQNRML